MKTVSFTNEITPGTYSNATLTVTKQGNVSGIAAGTDTGPNVEYFPFSASTADTFQTFAPSGGLYKAWFAGGGNPTITQTTGIVWNPPAGVSSVALSPGVQTGPNGDGFVCSKFIRNVRFYIFLQFDVAVSAGTVVVIVNGVGVVSASMNVGNTVGMKTSSVVEWGGIPAGQQVHLRFLFLPNASVHDLGTYAVIETDP